MKPGRFTEEQLIAILREQEAGARTAEVCRRHGISSATFYKRKAKFGGMDVPDARRLKALEDENARLTKPRRPQAGARHQGAAGRPAGPEPALVDGLSQRRAERRSPLPHPRHRRRFYAGMPVPGRRHLAARPQDRA